MIDQAEKSSAWLAGLDVGGTKIEAALVDRSGRLLSQAYLPMDSRSDQRAVISIVAALRQLLGESTAPSNFLQAVGVAITGKIHAGTVELAVNLKLRNYPLAQALAEIFHVPFFLENDVRTAALGAYRHFSSQRPLRSLVYLSIGTGIAAGLVLDGRLYRGANGMAGEVGHIVVAPGGSLCACGLHGCLETVAAGPAIAAAAAQAVRSGQATSLADAHPLDSRAVYQAYAAGDRAAGDIVRRVSTYLAHAIQGLIMAYDVDLLVLGGGVTGDSHLFLPPILEVLSHMRLQSELSDMLLQEDKIALLPKGINPAVLGAIELAEKGLAAENLREKPYHS
jgi:glucokinase